MGTGAEEKRAGDELEQGARPVARDGGAVARLGARGGRRDGAAGKEQVRGRRSTGEEGEHGLVRESGGKKIKENKRGKDKREEREKRKDPKKGKGPF